MQRFDAVDAEGIDVFRVVRPCHRAAHSGSEPCVRFAAGDLVAEDVVGKRGFDEAKGILRGDGTERNGRLGRVRRHDRTGADDGW